jgi:hypothetical protein
MAIIKLGGGIAAASGSVGGVVFSRNKAGAYIRNRSIPINPSSSRQQTVRFAMAALATRWVETLTAAQRAAWETYAEAVQIPNSLGEMRNVGGLAMYVRSNSPRIGFTGSTLTYVDDAPTIFDLGTFTEPSVADLDETGQDFDWTFEDTDDWAVEDGGAMLIYASRPQNPSVNYFKGPYNAAEMILGSSTVTPTSPAAIDFPFPVVAGQKVFFRCNVARADGRLSSSFRTDGIVT